MIFMEFGVYGHHDAIRAPPPPFSCPTLCNIKIEAD
jgi:hypothetical protein